MMEQIAMTLRAEPGPDLGRLYTFGYQQVRTGEAMAALLGGRVDLVVDIRLNVYSGLRAFSMGTRATVEAHGYRYLSARGLGNADYRTGGMRLARPADIGLLVERLEAGENVAIMCACASPDGCHRRLVAGLVREAIPTLEVVDL